MWVHPEMYTIEGAEGLARVRRQHRAVTSLSRAGLPGAMAPIETPRLGTEQERPGRNPRQRGGRVQGKTGALGGQGRSGVGPAHSSDEVGEVQFARAGGAKGRAGQGSRRRER